ncbi:MAG: PKD domain-containing protein [bacterium]|jgi:hypothetical protein
MNRYFITVTASVAVLFALIPGCGKGKADTRLQPEAPPAFTSDTQSVTCSQHASFDPIIAAKLSEAFEKEWGRTNHDNAPQSSSFSSEAPDPSLLAMLRMELERSLAESKQPSREGRAPVGMAGKVRDLRRQSVGGFGHAGLAWTYTNLGDYNLDGEVTVADLTPIAVYYGKSVFDLSLGSRDRELIEYLDGDESGIVDIGDVTPIALNFDSQVRQYIVQGSDSPDGPFRDATQRLVAFDFNDSVSEKITLSIAISLPYKYFIVVPVDGSGNRGEPSFLAPNGNAGGEYLGPSIVSISGNYGMEGDTITLSAELENSEGADFNWSFGGAGSPSFSSSPSPSLTLSKQGVYLAKLTVSNKYGWTARGFSIAVWKPAEIPDGCIWIDTLDSHPDRRVVFDVYAHRMSTAAQGYLELEIEFPAPISAGDVDLIKYTPADASQHEDYLPPVQNWICNDDFANPMSAWYGAVSNGQKLVMRGYLDVGAGESARICSFSLPAIATQGIQPSSVRITLFEKSGARSLDNWAGRFEWKTESGFSVKRGLGYGGEPIMPSAGAAATFNSAANAVDILLWSWLPGDTDGDNVVSAFDFQSIALRFLNGSDDGEEDDLDKRVDADGNGEVGISDITPISLNHHRTLAFYDKYCVYRDGAEIARIDADPLPERNSPIRPVQFQIYTDQTPPTGGHVYTVRAYDSATGEYGPESKGAAVSIPESAN